MAIKHIKKCITSLNFREMKIQTTVRYHLEPTMVTISKQNENLYIVLFFFFFFFIYFYLLEANYFTIL